MLYQMVHASEFMSAKDTLQILQMWSFHVTFHLRLGHVELSASVASNPMFWYEFHMVGSRMSIELVPFLKELCTKGAFNLGNVVVRYIILRRRRRPLLFILQPHFSAKVFLHLLKKKAALAVGLFVLLHGTVVREKVTATFAHGPNLEDFLVMRSSGMRNAAAWGQEFFRAKSTCHRLHFDILLSKEGRISLILITEYPAMAEFWSKSNAVPPRNLDTKGR